MHSAVLLYGVYIIYMQAMISLISKEIKLPYNEAVRHYMWLKADGCDVNEGLMELTTMVWNGDVDLGDGSLQQQYDAYQLRLANVKHIEIGCSSVDITSKLKSTLDSVDVDLKFIHSGVLT